MLDVKTLRIGNIFRYKDGRLCKIEGIPHGVAINVASVHNYDISGSFNPNNFNNVEITPEILIELGFTYNNFHDKFLFKAGDYFVCIKKWSTDDFWKFYDDDSDAECYFTRNLKFVDELQNLVFFLKNIEL
jgi:hypothetical protein